MEKYTCKLYRKEQLIAESRGGENIIRGAIFGALDYYNRFHLECKTEAYTSPDYIPTLSELELMEYLNIKWHDYI